MAITDNAEFFEKNFPTDWTIPADLTGRVFIAGLRENKECYYLVDFAQRTIKSCVVSIDDYIATFSKYIEQNLSNSNFPYACKSSTAVAFSFVQPHEGFELADGRVVVGMHNCSYAREIDFSQQQVGHMSEQDAFIPRMMSAQNSLDRVNGEYLYTMTDMQQRLRVYGGEKLELETELYSVDTAWNKPRKLASLKTLEAIHEVKQTPDPDYVILTEFCLTAQGSAPVLEEDPFATYSLWREYELAGLQTNRIYLIEKNSGSVSASEVDGKTPGHIEFSRADPERFYLSCHNLSKAHGKLILHGEAKLLGGRMHKGELQFSKHYHPKGLYRLTSHKLFSYKGENYIVLSAYPNRFHILLESSLHLHRDEQLFNHEPIEAEGLHFCTLLGHMPIWIETSDNGRYILLFSNELIYIYDMQSHSLNHVRGYSHHGLFVGTAHLTNFNDSHY
ncbi:hypothetical protein [Pseudomonas orientalis]|uniref:Uncharacterized protein n=1 Tax=Pseudomonas orientalis TaxID=76758 RepID=A0A1H2EWJ1_9PSED|nr:hypothetical protein [Pseudomonas orientalis]KRP67563.1 hypothetical protein TU82_02025 [Pseudomonas orientalis]SDT99419.1 hypothetical protein SAMN04490197_1804 [Pseudomonas orientalis]